MPRKLADWNELVPHPSAGEYERYDVPAGEMRKLMQEFASLQQMLTESMSEAARLQTALRQTITYIDQHRLNETPSLKAIQDGIWSVLSESK